MRTPARAKRPCKTVTFHVCYRSVLLRIISIVMLQGHSAHTWQTHSRNVEYIAKRLFQTCFVVFTYLHVTQCNTLSDVTQDITGISANKSCLAYRRLTIRAMEKRHFIVTLFKSVRFMIVSVM